MALCQRTAALSYIAINSSSCAHLRSIASRHVPIVTSISSSPLFPFPIALRRQNRSVACLAGAQRRLLHVGYANCLKKLWRKQWENSEDHSLHWHGHATAYVCRRNYAFLLRFRLCCIYPKAMPIRSRANLKYKKQRKEKQNEPICRKSSSLVTLEWNRYWRRYGGCLCESGATGANNIMIQDQLCYYRWLHKQVLIDKPLKSRTASLV